MFKNAIWLFILAFVALIVFLPSYTKMQDLKQKNEDYQNQIQNLTKKNVELTEEKRRLTEDPDYLEKVAREKMGLIKEGEVVYQIVPAGQQRVEKPKPTSTPGPAASH
jgi:cell division protein FtsB